MNNGIKGKFKNENKFSLLENDLISTNLLKIVLNVKNTLKIIYYKNYSRFGWSIMQCNRSRDRSETSLYFHSSSEDCINPIIRWFSSFPLPETLNGSPNLI
jgi:hypothetical protein